MGNVTSLGKKRNDDDIVDDVFTKSEKECLHQMYHDLFGDKSLEENKKRFCKKFESQEIPHFAVSIYDSCCRTLSASKATPDFSLFLAFSMSVTRSTSNHIIRKIWGLVCYDSTYATGTHTRSFAVLRLILECCGTTTNMLCKSYELYVAADRLLQHLKYKFSSSSRNNQGVDYKSVTWRVVEDSEVELAGFIDWINEYAPETANVFVSCVFKKQYMQFLNYYFINNYW